MEHSERFREAQEENEAWTELSDSLLEYVVPLCTQAPGKRPSHVGTGVLAHAAGRPVLISARHVLASAHSLFFYIEHKTIRRLTGSLVLGRVKDGEVDRIDVAAMLLEGAGLPPYPGVDKFCLDAKSMVAPGAMPRAGKHYLITGYPASRTRANPHAMELKTEAWCLIGESSKPEMYDRVGVTQETHIVLPLDRKATIRTDGRAQVFPDPHGMSGSAVWWLPDQRNGLEVPQLVAIVIEYHAQSNALVATDIREALHQIALASAR